MNEKYNLEKAQKEAGILLKKVELKEASDYSEAEKQLEDKKKLFNFIINHFNKLLDVFINVPQKLSDSYFTTINIPNLAFYLKDERPDLEKIIKEQIMPKVTITMAQEVMDKLKNGITSESLSECRNSLGHQLLPFGRDVYIEALKKFRGDMNIIFISRDAPNTLRWLAGDLGDEEMERLVAKKDKMSETELANYEGINLQRAYVEFMEKIKDTDEYKVDLKATILEVKQELEKELA